MRHDRRGSWYLLTGAVVGVAIGLLFAWVVSPVEYVDAPPYALRADFKDEYRALVAAAYLYSSDLLRAEDRLEQLKDENTSQSLAMQAQHALAEGRPEAEVKALGLLAMALGQGVTPPAPNTTASQVIILETPTGVTTTTPVVLEPMVTSSVSPQQIPTLGTPASTSTPSSTAPPTLPPISSPTPGAAFLLHENKLMCNPDQTQPLIQVQILDAAEQPVPSVELVVAWDGGEDHFFTGLKPELGLGYADFVMTPEVVYSLHLAEGEQSVNDLTAAQCLSEDESRYWGSWLLTFIQP